MKKTIGVEPMLVVNKSLSEKIIFHLLRMEMISCV